MTKKILSLLLSFSLTAISVFSQNFSSPKKGSLIGFSANLTDFSQPLSLSNASISTLDPGFSIMYWKGLSKRIDLSVRYNGVLQTILKRTPTAVLIMEMNLRLHYI